MRYNEICEAIQNKSIVEFNYDGFHRTVEPHCHGLTLKGNSALRAYQTGGGSKSGSVPSWRMFKLDEATNIRVLKDTFTGPRSGYKKGDKGMSKIYCEL